VADDQQQGPDRGQYWVAICATARARFFQYVPPVASAPPVTVAPANIQPDLGFPFPNANTAGATDQLPVICEGLEDQPEPLRQPGLATIWLDK